MRVSYAFTCRKAGRSAKDRLVQAEGISSYFPWPRNPAPGAHIWFVAEVVIEPEDLGKVVMPSLILEGPDGENLGQMLMQPIVPTDPERMPIFLPVPLEHVRQPGPHRIRFVLEGGTLAVAEVDFPAG